MIMCGRYTLAGTLDEIAAYFAAKSGPVDDDGNPLWDWEPNYNIAPASVVPVIAFAQDHLRILSGLYGVLRPLDAIQPYRLEMGTKLATSRGKSLYEFWGSSLGNLLREDVNSHDDQTIVNLASNEYFKAVDQKALGARIISAKFLEEKEGKIRPVQYYTKFGRGLMARWIMTNRVDRADGLKDFNLGNYKYDKVASTETLLVFARPQPAPKKK